MATRGRLEGLVTVPTGGWTGTVGGSGWTLPAGPYFLSSAATSGSSLIAALQSVIDAATAATVTVSLSASETGTGLVTITSSSSVAIAWTSTDLRDLLGFASNLASGTTWTGTGQARSLWLPDCAYWAPNAVATWRGWRESDFMASEHPSGYVAAFQGRSLTALELAWNAVSKQKALITHEVTTNESWERFALDCLWAAKSWGTPGGPIRFYPDAASSVAFGTYTIPGMREIRPTPTTEGWPGGPWRVSVPRLLLDPSYAAYGA